VPKDIHAHHYWSTGFMWVAVVAILAQAGMLFLALFEPGLPYIVSNPRGDPPESGRFVRTLAALTNAQMGEQTQIEVLTNGREYYPAELAAIRAAKTSICLEAYIFEPGEVGNNFIDALAERAQAGVRVHMVTDAVGSIKLSSKDLEPLKKAGGRHAFYMPLRWYTWPRMNNRTHRELLIVDGKVGFVGGSGWADHWWKPVGKEKLPWRDTMIRVEGPAVTGLQSTFSENWLEASGQVLTGKAFFPFETGAGNSLALVVRSSPSPGRSTPARVLIQTLLASALHRIYITTPYFLPDESIRDEIVRAMKERGVEVKIITPGPGTDHLLTRRSSRRLFGDLLAAGAHIYEYQPSMIHAKILVVDSRWVAIGSTNIDPRSFKLNDEVNLAAPDPVLAQRLEQDFNADLAHSREVSYEEWKHRSFAERAHELFGGLLERQQ
jgi:cardiolipin synthase